MPLRDIIEIDEALCDGCGLCVPACQEGALAVVDGKLRVLDEVRCDGAGACIGHCPTGALKVIQRDAPAFDERFAQPPQPAEPPVTLTRIGKPPAGLHGAGSCPGSRTSTWANAFPSKAGPADPAHAPSALRQWPVQLHLVSPDAAFWNGREMLLAADCVAFSLGAFHRQLLEGRSLAVACPKLDDPHGYAEKVTRILAERDVRALRVVVMEVPCCGGLARLALDAVQKSGYQGEVEILTISIMGEVTQRRVVQHGAAAQPQLGAPNAP